MEETKGEKEALWPRMTGKVEWLNTWELGSSKAGEDKWSLLYLTGKIQKVLLE